MTVPHLDQLSALLDALREAYARGEGEASAELARTTERIRGDASYRAALRDEVRTLLSTSNSTHLLTEYGILSDEPLGSGVLRRLAARMAPAPARSSGLEVSLSDLIHPGDAGMISSLDPDALEAWAGAVLGEQSGWDDRSQLASAIVILATRVAGAGVDARLSERMPTLEAWNSPFVALSRTLDRYAEAYVHDEHEPLADGALGAIDACRAQVVRFRAEKEELGTTLHLSSASLRMLQQLDRLTLLVECTVQDQRAHAVSALALALRDEVCRSRPVRHFVRQKLDLVAYLVVGHAAQKGDRYAVRTRGEYWKFWGKSLFGGTLVAVFALLKLHLSHEALAPGPQAFVYGLNYAICFALIYLLGATLATKQPALTASRIADALDEGPEHEDFPELVRAIWRSQFVSFLGNIVGAAGFAVLVALAFSAVTGNAIVSHDEALYLAKKMHPLDSASIWFAAIAGVMLSAAGFFAGWVDNAVVFHRVADRMCSGGGLFGLLPTRVRTSLAARVEKSTGALAGNIALGFMLGSAGAVGLMLGLPFDIRHIAFSSSHGAMALLYAPELRNVTDVLIVLTSVSLIGLVNFVVSFSLTLMVAINARRLDGIGWRDGLRGIVRLARKNPIGFFLPLGDRDPEPTQAATSPSG